MTLDTANSGCKLNSIQSDTTPIHPLNIGFSVEACLEDDMLSSYCVKSYLLLGETAMQMISALPACWYRNKFFFVMVVRDFRGLGDLG
jgi:hypothetical protein